MENPQSPFELGTIEHITLVWLNRSNPGLGFPHNHKIHTLVQNELHALTTYPFKSTTSESMEFIRDAKTNDEYFLAVLINVLFDTVSYPMYDTNGNQYFYSKALAYKDTLHESRQETIVIEFDEESFIKITYYPDGTNIQDNTIYPATDKNPHTLMFWNSPITHERFMQFENIKPTGKLSRIILNPHKTKITEE